MARGVMRFMAGNGREVMGVTVHGSGSLRLACAGVLEHALRLLRLRGEEFGVGQTTHLGLVLQGTEAEVVWALKQDLSADARSTHSPSHGPSFSP